MITLDIVEEAGDWQALAGFAALAQRGAEAALAALGEADDEPVAATLLLADDATVRDLNREWRGQDKPTNVLSFPADGPGEPGEARPIGDIALAYETLVREAADEGKPTIHHAAHLVVHGVLHLLGHDHGDEAEADAMERIEVTALAAIGIPDPYADTEVAD